MPYGKVDELAINTIRTLAVDATFQANSGHPGAPMGMAPVAHVLFNKFMTFNPKNPDWFNRDRFVLSYVPPIPILELFNAGTLSMARCSRGLRVVVGPGMPETLFRGESVPETVAFLVSRGLWSQICRLSGQRQHFRAAPLRCGAMAEISSERDMTKSLTPSAQ
ncbi:hypothetical protein BU26DRAFT_254094 [Trematosphaeria pertusa]|uniref:Transketolase N-terminal domain-containing protein n=1 Tax=Trematosphaeria pertusa TaxID=390896 RepID=A0A6A6IPD2_9PLEO|nr:uncharacterized protein BU26DRAFT_254094 [Trematosphaeria pertusa]KAF2252256.1 hypothetical protein BU26DRAFT_254094 [Trematosphaeria pertusa]